MPSNPGRTAKLLAREQRWNLLLSAENKVMFDNLTSTQARCTELLEEVRKYKAALQQIAGCSGGQGYMPDLAKRALT